MRLLHLGRHTGVLEARDLSEGKRGCGQCAQRAPLISGEETLLRFQHTLAVRQEAGSGLGLHPRHQGSEGPSEGLWATLLLCLLR